MEWNPNFPVRQSHIKSEKYSRDEQIEENCVSGVVSASSNSEHSKILRKISRSAVFWRNNFPFLSFGHRTSLPFLFNLPSIAHIRKGIPHVIVHFTAALRYVSDPRTRSSRIMYTDAREIRRRRYGRDNTKGNIGVTVMQRSWWGTFRKSPTTYRVWRTGLPVRSAVLKPHAGELVVGWVTTSESSLLYVFFPPYPF